MGADPPWQGARSLTEKRRAPKDTCREEAILAPQASACAARIVRNSRGQRRCWLERCREKHSGEHAGREKGPRRVPPCSAYPARFSILGFIHRALNAACRPISDGYHDGGMLPESQRPGASLLGMRLAPNCKAIGLSILFEIGCNSGSSARGTMPAPFAIKRLILVSLLAKMATGFMPGREERLDLRMSGMWDDLQKFAPNLPFANLGGDDTNASASAAGAGRMHVASGDTVTGAGSERVFSSRFDVNRPLPSDEELRAIEAENDRLSRYLSLKRRNRQLQEEIERIERPFDHVQDEGKVRLRDGAPRCDIRATLADCTNVRS